MDKFLTDVHNHSSFSYDGVNKLSEMLQCAQEKGLAFYGVSEHVDFDICPEAQLVRKQEIDAEEYFHTARHLQEDYAGCMNVLVGAELGYSSDTRVQERYLEFCKRYQPDFVVNSVHSKDGWAYSSKRAFYELLRFSVVAHGDERKNYSSTYISLFAFNIANNFVMMISLRI